MKPTTPDSFPHNLDAEKAVLGAILVRNEAMADVVDRLLPQHFYREAHQIVYSNMIALDAQAKPIDLVTLRAALGNAGKLDTCGGPAYIARLMDGVPRSTDAGHYADLVKTAAFRREAMQLGERLRADAADLHGDLDTRELLQQHAQALLDLACDQQPDTFVAADVLMHETFAEIERIHANERTGVPTGFRDLDRMTGGFRPGDLIVIGGRPSMGKTAEAIGHAVAAGKASCTVAFFSLEMSCRELGLRMVTSEARIDAHRLRERKLRDEEYSRLTAALGRIEPLPIKTDDAASLTVADVRARARRLKAQHGLGLIVIDYLQLLASPPGKRYENRNLEIAAMSRALKALAKELAVPVIVLSQLNRDVDGRADHRPMLSDLRDSGAIEQDADLVLFPFRPEHYDQTPENAGVVELIIAKQRNGPTGIVELRWLAHCTRFEDAA